MQPYVRARCKGLIPCCLLLRWFPSHRSYLLNTPAEQSQQRKLQLPLQLLLPLETRSSNSSSRGLILLQLLLDNLRYV